MIGKLVLFAGGFLTGTAGVRILSGRDAKKVYTHVTAAALRCKDEVMECVTKVRENAEDIYEDAKDINAKRAAEAETKDVIKDGDFREENKS